MFLSPGSLEQPYGLLLLLLLLLLVVGLLVFMRLFTQHPPNMTHDWGIFAVFCFLFQRRLKAKKHKRLHKNSKLLGTQHTFVAEVCKRYCNHPNRNTYSHGNTAMYILATYPCSGTKVWSYDSYSTAGEHRPNRFLLADSSCNTETIYQLQLPLLSGCCPQENGKFVLVQ